MSKKQRREAKAAATAEYVEPKPMSDMTPEELAEFLRTAPVYLPKQKVAVEPPAPQMPRPENVPRISSSGGFNEHRRKHGRQTFKLSDLSDVIRQMESLRTTFGVTAEEMNSFSRQARMAGSAHKFYGVSDDKDIDETQRAQEDAFMAAIAGASSYETYAVSEDENGKVIDMAIEAVIVCERRTYAENFSLHLGLPIRPSYNPYRKLRIVSGSSNDDLTELYGIGRETPIFVIGKLTEKHESFLRARHGCYVSLEGPVFISDIMPIFRAAGVRDVCATFRESKFVASMDEPLDLDLLDFKIAKIEP